MENKKLKNKQIAIFEGQKIRRLWDEKKEIFKIVLMTSLKFDFLYSKKSNMLLIKILINNLNNLIPLVKYNELI